jgi:hypothetical protein
MALWALHFFGDASQPFSWGFVLVLCKIPQVVPTKGTRMTRAQKMYFKALLLGN